LGQKETIDQKIELWNKDGKTDGYCHLKDLPVTYVQFQIIFHIMLLSLPCSKPQTYGFSRALLTVKYIKFVS
jgi:hypothetical protein